MPVIGTFLKKWREDRSVSLESVYEKTRIPLETLRKLEANQFSDLPRVYVQSFLKSYCKEVGIRDPLLSRLVADFDKDDVIRKLFQPDEMVSNPEPIKHREVVQENPVSTEPDEFSHTPPTTGTVIESSRLEQWFHANKWYMVSVLAIGLVTWGLLEIFFGSEPETIAKVTPLDFNQVVQSVQNENPPPEQVKTESEPTTTTIKRDTVVKTPARTVLKQDTTLTDFSRFKSIPLRIASGADSTWISLVIDGKPSAAFTMAPNRAIIRSGRHFVVTIGKIDNVSISAENTPLNKPASSGAVFNWVITGPANP